MITLLRSTSSTFSFLNIWLEKPEDWKKYNTVYIYFFGVMASTCFMVCIALERYLVIVLPLWYRFRRTIKTSVLVCVMVWPLPTIYILPSYFCINFVVEEAISATFLLLPLPLLIFFLGGTLKALSASISVPPDKKRRIVGVLVLVLLLYTLLFLPSIIWSLTENGRNNNIVSNVSFVFLRLSPLADSVMFHRRMGDFNNDSSSQDGSYYDSYSGDYYMEEPPGNIIFVDSHDQIYIDSFPHDLPFGSYAPLPSIIITTSPLAPIITATSLWAPVIIFTPPLATTIIMTKLDSSSDEEDEGARAPETDLRQRTPHNRRISDGAWTTDMELTGLVSQEEAPPIEEQVPPMRRREDQRHRQLKVRDTKPHHSSCYDLRGETRHPQKAKQEQLLRRRSTSETEILVEREMERLKEEWLRRRATVDPPPGPSSAASPIQVERSRQSPDVESDYGHMVQQMQEVTDKTDKKLKN
ncbi:hypothetical protein ABVT39_013890 [Epinephelus coioides]